MSFPSRLWMIVMFVLLATGIVRADAFAGCDGLFKYGIHDMDEAATDADRTVSFREWFCQREFPSKADAVDVLNSTSVPLETVPVKLGPQDSDGDFSQSYAAFCSDTAISSPMNQELSRNLQKINRDLINNLNACMSTNGLHAWIKQTKVHGRFLLNIRNNSKPATVFSITRFNVACDNLRVPFDIASGEKSFTCTRINPTAQSSLWILSSEPVVEGRSYNVGKTTYTPPTPSARPAAAEEADRKGEPSRETPAPGVDGK